jgi:hypothetical protein
MDIRLLILFGSLGMAGGAHAQGTPMPGTNAIQPPRQAYLIDMNDAIDLRDSWSSLELRGSKEPPAVIERVPNFPTLGKSSVKITFAGGTWPTLTSKLPPADWMGYLTFRAELMVSRPCLVGFQVLQEKSTRERGWDGSISRWVKTVLAQPGKNDVVAALQPNDYSAINPKFGKVVRFEIFMYKPNPGESIILNNVRISSEPMPKTEIKTEFRVLGTPWSVGGVQELGKKLAKEWKPPAETTVDEIEATIRKTHAALKQAHPRSVLAIFRDGDKGYDPANPEKVFAGWKDAYWSSHGPDGMTIDRAENFGKHASQEIFMRHRSPLMRVDLSSIPKGAKILAAKLIVVRANDFYDKERDPRTNPNMWVAEACNRAWEEYEVNAYEYARGKFWKNVGGMQWDGKDPDFWPVYLAHGPGGGKVSAWDFTEAVRFWTAGGHANHGFMLHCDAKDWLGRAHYRESAEVKNRPALLVIYEPK